MSDMTDEEKIAEWLKNNKPKRSEDVAHGVAGVNLVPTHIITPQHRANAAKAIRRAKRK